MALGDLSYLRNLKNNVDQADFLTKLVASWALNSLNNPPWDLNKINRFFP
jgi:hypothetical protein